MNISVIGDETVREINNDVASRQTINVDQIKYSQPARKLKKVNEIKLHKFASLDNTPVNKETMVSPSHLGETDMLEDIHRKFENHSALSNELLNGSSDLMSPKNRYLYETAKTPMDHKTTFTFPKRNLSPLFSRVDIDQLNTKKDKPNLNFKGFA
jgi:hypothetical protein